MAEQQKFCVECKQNYTHYSSYKLYCGSTCYQKTKRREKAHLKLVGLAARYPEAPPHSQWLWHGKCANCGHDIGLVTRPPETDDVSEPVVDPGRKMFFTDED